MRLSAMMNLMLEQMHEQPIRALDLHMVAAPHAAETAQGPVSYTHLTLPTILRV